jgi:hypothetical protein
MAAKTGTYTLIASTTLASATGTVTFSSVPQTYTDLIIVSSRQQASAARLYLRFNNDGTSLYSDTWLSGEGATVYSGRDTSASAISLGGIWNGTTTTTWATNITHIMDYANTTTFKSTYARDSNDKSGTGTAEIIIGLYRSTSAITTVNVVGGSNFSIGSTFKLYGIEAAK